MICVAIRGNTAEFVSLRNFCVSFQKSRTYTSSASVKSLCISFLSHTLSFFFLSKHGFPVKGYQGKIAARSQINSSGYLKQLRLEIFKMKLDQIGLKPLSVSAAGTRSSCQGQHHIPSTSPWLKHWVNCFKSFCDTLKSKFC